MKKKSKEQLIKEYADIGVDYKKFISLGESNIIIQMFGTSDISLAKEYHEEDSEYTVSPTIYMPRKEACFESDPINLHNENERNDLLEHIDDSIERMKMFIYLLSKQRDEIKEFGYPKTTCYYPELNEYENENETGNT